jgi:formylglycine-generating enzyme required for sulfatase activity
VPRVTIPQPFAVGVYEVTFAEWDACVSDGSCNGYRPLDRHGDHAGRSDGRGKRPVIHVGWKDAKAYVAWLSRETGERYRLLSESEWEYAARAGTTTKYHWGNSFDNSRAYIGDKTVPVGGYAPNEFGLHDVHGNVSEWVEDCWHGSYEGAPSDGRAWTSGDDCGRRVLRGGSSSRRLRSTRAYYTWVDWDYRIDYNGFRVARTLFTP